MAVRFRRHLKTQTSDRDHGLISAGDTVHTSTHSKGVASPWGVEGSAKGKGPLEPCEVGGGAVELGNEETCSHRGLCGGSSVSSS